VKKMDYMDENKQRIGFFLVIRQTLLLISYKKAELYISKFVSNNDFFHNFYYNNYFYKKVMRRLSRLVWTLEDNISNICTIELCQ